MTLLSALPEQDDMPKGPAYNTFSDSTKFLRGDQTWNVPSGSGGVLEDALEDAQELTISDGSITPTLPSGIYANLSVTGEGDTDDNLTTIVADATWEGKRAIVRKAGAGIITAKRDTPLLLESTDKTLSSVDDCLVLEWKSANVWRQISFANCG